MNKITIVICCLLFLFAEQSLAFSSKARWFPTEKAISKMLQCHNNPKGYMFCLENLMYLYEASDEAVEFTKAIDGRGFMQSFKPLNGLALVSTLEMGADYSQGCYLVNGDPSIVNVFDYNLISKDLWPTSCKIANIKHEGDNIIYMFNYEQKKCRACKVEAVKQVGFTFDKNDKYRGEKII